MDDETPDVVGIDAAPPTADEKAAVAALTPQDYIAPPELHRLMESQARPIVIVDMRDEDRKIGHIRGSTNLPSKLLTDEQLASVYHSAPVGALIVFHCMFSQTRGPTAYVRFMKLLREWTLADGGAKRLEARILRGGFRGWRRHIGVTFPDTMIVPPTAVAASRRVRRPTAPAAGAAGIGAPAAGGSGVAGGKMLPGRTKRETSAPAP